MLSLQKLLPFSLFLSLVTSSAIAHIADQAHTEREAQADLEEFERLLDQVDPPSLHAALHDYSPKKFTHGMFEKDRTAAEALHKEDASIASSIVALAKRQTPGNGTVTTSTPSVPDSSSTPEVPDSASATTLVTPVAPIATGTPLSTLPAGSVTTESLVVSGSENGLTTILSTSTAPLVPGASSTDDASGPTTDASSAGAATTSAPEASPLTAGEVITSTNAQGDLVANTLSDGEVVTSINAQGVTIVTTVGGGSKTIAPNDDNNESGSSDSATTSTRRPQSQTTTSKRTTTLADGRQSTVTAVTVVPASGADESVPSGTAGPGSATGTAAASPGLQTGIAPKSISFGREMLAVVGGAVGVAMMM